MSNYKEELKSRLKDFAFKAAFKVLSDWVSYIYENFKRKNWRKKEDMEDEKKQEDFTRQKEEIIIDHITIPVKPIKVTWIPSPHFSARGETEIDAIVLHHTGSTIESAISWTKMKESKVSYHYLVAKTGDLYQMVKEKDKAWHAGVSVLQGKNNVNKFSIGIAFEGKGEGTIPYTKEQYEMGAYLCKLLKKKYERIKNDRIVGHKQVAPERKYDPNNFDWHYFYGLIDK